MTRPGIEASCLLAQILIRAFPLPLRERARERGIKITGERGEGFNSTLIKALAFFTLLAPRYAKPLAPLPQGLAADAELFGQFGFGHAVLVLQYEALKIVFQGKLLYRLC